MSIGLCVLLSVTNSSGTSSAAPRDEMCANHLQVLPTAPEMKQRTQKKKRQERENEIKNGR